METGVGVYFGVLPASLAVFWQLAQKELQKINMYKAPQDKLVCILNCCKVIGNLLLHASISSEDVSGADEFLPVLIYVTIKVRLNIYHCIIYQLKPYSYISGGEREGERENLTIGSRYRVFVFNTKISIFSLFWILYVVCRLLS